MGNDGQELPDEVQAGEHATSFLNQHPYGLLFADDEAAEYEFIWAKSPEELFEKAYEMVEDAQLTYLKDYGATELDKKSRDALEKARTHFEMHGLTETTLDHLMSIDPYGDRAGIPWWGSFDQLKTSDHGWAMQMRSSFRGGGNEVPIRADEEADFATYVTREPFTL